MNFRTEYYRMVANYMLDNPSVRYGQALFNVLEEIYPATCFDLANTSADPYYAKAHDDERIANFWAWFEQTFPEDS